MAKKTKADEKDESAGSSGITISPAAEKLLVGNQYTAEIEHDFEDGDTVMFSHPAGWDVKAAVLGRKARGSFMIERMQAIKIGFKLNGQTIGTAEYETYTG